MFRHLFCFELRMQLAGPLFWLALVAFAAMGFDIGLSDPIQINPVSEGLHQNSPLMVAVVLGGMSIIGMLVTAMFVGTALLRDDSARTADLLHVTRITKGSYLGSRFAAGYVLTLTVLLGAVVMMAIGYHMSWLPAGAIGPTPWLGFVVAIGVYMAPNLLFGASIVAASIAITRSMKYCVVAVVMVLVLHNVSNAIVSGNPLLAVLVDPFGGQFIVQLAKNWTAADINTRLPIGSTLWLNRLLWLSVSTGLCALAFARFRLSHNEGQRASKPAKDRPAPDTQASLITVIPRHGFIAEAKKALSLARSEFLNSALGIPFLVSVIAVVGTVAVYLIFSRAPDGSPTYPVTHLMLGVIDAAIHLPAMAIMGFYAGEMVHRERDDRLADVVDAYPVSRAAWLIGKAGSLTGLLALLIAACLLTGVTFQLLSGFTAIEPGLYLAGGALIGLPLLIFAGAALALQILCANKFVGYLLTVVVGASVVLLPTMGIHDHLLLFGTAPPLHYSDMSGFGPFLAANLWFGLYWGGAVLATILVASTFRVRGETIDTGSRWAAAKLQLVRPMLVIGIVFCLGVSVAAGAWIFHNTHQLNPIDPAATALTQKGRYERLYRQFLPLPQPRITAVNLAVDIHPAQREVDFHGSYTLTNETAHPIATLTVTTDPRTETTVDHAAMTTQVVDAVAGFSVYRLDTPVQPGQSITLTFSTNYRHRGFTNDADDADLVENGTFVSNLLLPSVGYDHKREIIEPANRAAHGLGARVSVVDTNNPYVSQDADRIAFHAVVSTDPDQVALAPGKQVRTWTAGSRRYFEYASEKPMAYVYGFLSARWVVTKAQWHGVTIEVYADPKHPWNVDRIVAALKDGLSAYSSEYGPYPLSEIRVAEFPGYRDFAQSFAGLIAFSEDLGFTSQGPVDGGIDFAYFITAHELAHQWWGHQLLPADAPGALLLTESMAQYSAIQLVDLHEHSSLAALLAYERGQYRVGLSSVDGHDEPLDKVTDQAFVAYHKGSLAMLAYQTMLGPARTTRVLRDYFTAYAGLAAPYPLASNFAATLRSALPPAARPRFDQWFTGGGIPASAPPRRSIAAGRGGDKGDPLGRPISR